jgi:hypothetical protein
LRRQARVGFDLSDNAFSKLNVDNRLTALFSATVIALTVPILSGREFDGPSSVNADKSRNLAGRYFALCLSFLRKSENRRRCSEDR